MFKNASKVIIKAITPIHAGMGRTLGLIDMPIQKEKHTGIPKIEGSTIKGCLRELYRINYGTDIDKLFGPEKGNECAGVLGFTDAKLLFYPVISLNNIFVYITCPYLLNRYLQDKILQNGLKAKNEAKNEAKITFLQDLSEGEFIFFNESDESNKQGENDKSIVIDEYYFENSKNYASNNKKALEELKGDFELNKKGVIICDSDFIEIISLCKEVVIRNKVDNNTGTVQTGSLFSEEYLPSETILYMLLLKNGIESNDKNEKTLYEDYLKKVSGVAQIGGNFTIGKGIIKMSVVGGEKKHAEK